MQISDYKPAFTLMYLVFLELDTGIATWILISFMIIFWDSLMFYQIFFPPQVKRCTIIKHGIYEFPHELPNDLRLKKIENVRKVSKLHRMIA